MTSTVQARPRVTQQNCDVRGNCEINVMVRGNNEINAAVSGNYETNAAL